MSQRLCGAAAGASSPPSGLVPGWGLSKTFGSIGTSQCLAEANAAAANASPEAHRWAGSHPWTSAAGFEPSLLRGVMYYRSISGLLVVYEWSSGLLVVY